MSTEAKPKPQTMQGGGGGGAREALPVSKGRMPKPSLKAFVPPMIVDHTPKLAMDPSIIAPPDTPLPQSNLPNWGDPLCVCCHCYAAFSVERYIWYSSGVTTLTLKSIWE